MWVTEHGKWDFSGVLLAIDYFSDKDITFLQEILLLKYKIATKRHFSNDKIVALSIY